MRAERDDEYVPRRRHQERRLAYEIALGIVIGGSVLIMIDGVTSFIAAKAMLGQIQFGRH